MYDRLTTFGKNFLTPFMDIMEGALEGSGRVYVGNQGYRATYDVLMPAEKKAVTLYKELQNYEKGVKRIQEAIDNVQFVSDFVSSYDKGVG